MDDSAFLVALVVCLAGFAQGLSGFGFGLIAMPLLPLFMDLQDAVALTVPLNLVVCVTTFYSIRHHYSWRKGLGLVIGTCLGVPIGVFALRYLPQEVLLRTLGAVLIAFSLHELVLGRVKNVALSPRLGLPCGILSGGLSGAFNMGGPPAVAFTYSQVWSREQIVALLQVVFGVSSILRMLLLGSCGIISRSILITGMWVVLPLIGAIALGRRMFERVPHLMLRRGIFVFLGLMGLKYVL